MKALVAVLLLIVAIGAIILLSIISEKSSPSSTPSSSSQNSYITMRGTVENLSLTTNSLTLLSGDNDEVSISFSKNTTIQDTSGQPVKLSELFKGFFLIIEGTETESGVAAQTITVPQQANILLYSPKDGSTVTNHITIQGIARVFENVVSMQIKNLRSQKILLVGTLMAQSPDIGLFGHFEEEVILSSDNLQRGDNIEIKIFQASPKDGTPTDVVTSIVRYDKIAYQNIKVYFTNDTKNPNADCLKVYSVTREIPATQAVGKAALEELLKGPTDAEVIQGYGTALTEHVTLRSLNIKNGTAYADFSQELQENVGGSCRVQAIRSQIEQTLKQFTSVQQVVISVNGDQKTALQP